jgi:AraC-like DNA-binding protein
MPIFGKTSMDVESIVMYFSIMTDVYRETRFRLPNEPERAMGLWVDRIGSASSPGDVRERLRVLGQFAAVAVEAGQGFFYSPVAGQHSVSAGDVILLFPEEPNRYHGDPAWTTRWIVWNGPEAGLVARLGGLSAAQPIVRQAAAVVARTYVALDPLMQAEDFASALERKQHLLGLLQGLLRCLDRDRAPSQDAIVALVQRLGAENPERLAVPDMAAQCHLSVSQFRRVFRARTGRSPLDFLIAMRISRAKSLLARGGSIKDIAQQTGYTDVFHFMRAFKKATGQTAGQFAAANRTGRQPDPGG